MLVRRTNISAFKQAACQSQSQPHMPRATGLVYMGLCGLQFPLTWLNAPLIHPFMTSPATIVSVVRKPI